MSHDNRRRRSRQSAAQQAARQHLAHQPGLPFAGLLSSQDITQALPADLAWRQRLFTPVITVWVFLSQILDPDHSCRQAVARLLASQRLEGAAAWAGLILLLATLALVIAGLRAFRHRRRRESRR